MLPLKYAYLLKSLISGIGYKELYINEGVMEEGEEETRIILVVVINLYYTYMLFIRS